MLVRYFQKYFLFRFNVMYVGENNGNLSEATKMLFISNPFSK